MGKRNPNWYRKVRVRLGASLREFARLIGCNHMTVACWEWGRRSPTGPTRILFAVIDEMLEENDPGVVREKLVELGKKVP